jgi:hypothetical protein
MRAAQGKELFRTRNRSVRRLTQRLQRVARRTGEEAAEELTRAYRRLIGIAQQSRKQALRAADLLRTRSERRVERLQQLLEQAVPLVEQVISQTERRVIHGEKVPAHEKVVSLFEPPPRSLSATSTAKRWSSGANSGWKKWRVESSVAIASWKRLARIRRTSSRVWPIMSGASASHPTSSPATGRVLPDQ